MSIQLHVMRDTPERYIEVYQDESGKFHGIEYVNHPTPSGCVRLLPTLSDNRGWDTVEQAKEEFQKLLDNLPKPPWEA